MQMGLLSAGGISGRGARSLEAFLAEWPIRAAVGVDEGAEDARRIKTDGVAHGVRCCRPVPCYTLEIVRWCP